MLPRIFKNIILRNQQYKILYKKFYLCHLYDDAIHIQYRSIARNLSNLTIFRT